MTDWYDPTTWESAAKTAKALATTLTSLSKIRDRLSRKAPTRSARGTSRNLEQEVDALRTELNQLVDAMMQHIKTQEMVVDGFSELMRRLIESTSDKAEKNLNLIGKWGEVTTDIQKVLAIHEQRLRAIEGRPAKRPRKRAPATVKTRGPKGK